MTVFCARALKKQTVFQSVAERTNKNARTKVVLDTAIMKRRKLFLNLVDYVISGADSAPWAVFAKVNKGTRNRFSKGGVRGHFAVIKKSLDNLFPAPEDVGDERLPTKLGKCKMSYQLPVINCTIVYH